MSNFLDDIKIEFRKSNNVVVQLIMVNLGVWLFLMTMKLFSIFGLTNFASLISSQFVLPSQLNELIFRPWTIITYGLSHYSFGHILSNMIALWWFGRILQDLVGSNRVLGIYLISVIAAALAYLVIGQFSSENFRIGGYLIGASGGVYGIVVALATLSPTYRINMLFIGSVEVKWIALGFVILSYVGLGGANAGGNVAHLGGALMGFVFVKQLQAGRDLGRPMVGLIYSFPNLFKKKSKLKVSYKSKQKKAANDTSVDQEEMNRILDRINESGYASLSKEEKAKLFSYSKKKN